MGDLNKKVIITTTAIAATAAVAAVVGVVVGVTTASADQVTATNENSANIELIAPASQVLTPAQSSAVANAENNVSHASSAVAQDVQNVDSANSANSNASSALSSAADANSIASSAVSSASSANDTNQATVNNAQQAVNDWQDVQSSAQSAANNAQSDLDNANQAVSDAVSNAQQAQSDAQSAANSASAAQSVAQSSADAAQSSLSAAQSSAAKTASSAANTLASTPQTSLTPSNNDPKYVNQFTPGNTIPGSPWLLNTNVYDSANKAGQITSPSQLSDAIQDLLNLPDATNDEQSNANNPFTVVHNSPSAGDNTPLYTGSVNQNKELQAFIVEIINEYRAKHGLPPMEFSDVTQKLGDAMANARNNYAANQEENGIDQDWTINGNHGIAHLVDAEGDKQLDWDVVSPIVNSSNKHDIPDSEILAAMPSGESNSSQYTMLDTKVAILNALYNLLLNDANNNWDNRETILQDNGDATIYAAAGFPIFYGGFNGNSNMLGLVLDFYVMGPGNSSAMKSHLSNSNNQIHASDDVMGKGQSTFTEVPNPDYVAAKEANDEAQANLATANRNLANTTNDYDEAASKLASLQNEADNADDALADANQTLNQAEDNLAAAQQHAEDDANSAINQAENDYAQAQEAVNQAQNAVDNANNALVDANTANSYAQAKLQDAEDAVNKANNNYTEQQNILSDAQAKQVEAEEALQDAKDNLANTVGNSDAAQQALNDAQQALDDSTAKLQQLQQDNQYAAGQYQSALDDYNRALADSEQANNKLADNEVALKQAQDDLNNLLNEIANANKSTNPSMPVKPGDVNNSTSNNGNNTTKPATPGNNSQAGSNNEAKPSNPVANGNQQAKPATPGNNSQAGSNNEVKPSTSVSTGLDNQTNAYMSKPNVLINQNSVNDQEETAFEIFAPQSFKKVQSQSNVTLATPSSASILPDTGDTNPIGLSITGILISVGAGFVISKHK